METFEIEFLDLQDVNKHNDKELRVSLDRILDEFDWEDLEIYDFDELEQAS